MNGNPLGTILSGIIFFLDLPQSVAIRDKFHNLEFENINSCVKLNRHVNAAVIGSVFHTYIYAKSGKIAVHDGGVIALVICRLIFTVPVVGNRGEKRLQCLFSPMKIIIS